MSARVSVLSVFVFAVAVLQARCDGFYVNALSRVVVPDGGSALRSAVGGGFALGVPVGEKLSLEAESVVLENDVLLSARALCFSSALEEFDLLFGHERFDPFFTVGALSLVRAAVAGPEIGVGSYYYLSDTAAFRFDAGVSELLGGSGDLMYSFSVAFQQTF